MKLLQYFLKRAKVPKRRSRKGTNKRAKGKAALTFVLDRNLLVASIPSTLHYQTYKPRSQMCESVRGKRGVNAAEKEKLANSGGFWANL